MRKYIMLGFIAKKVGLAVGKKILGKIFRPRQKRDPNRVPSHQNAQIQMQSQTIRRQQNTLSKVMNLFQQLMSMFKTVLKKNDEMQTSSLKPVDNSGGNLTKLNELLGDKPNESESSKQGLVKTLLASLVKFLGGDSSGQSSSNVA